MTCARRPVPGVGEICALLTSVRDNLARQDPSDSYRGEMLELKESLSALLDRVRRRSARRARARPRPKNREPSATGAARQFAR
jgi:hypothetical protein